MIVTFKAGTPQSQIDSLIRWLQSQGYRPIGPPGNITPFWPWWVRPAA